MNSSENGRKVIEDKQVLKLIEQIEKSVLEVIVQLASEGKITGSRAREIAKRTLDLIKPGMTLEQLYQNLVKLDDGFPELACVVEKILKEYQIKKEEKAIELARLLIKNKRFCDAEKMIRNILRFKAGVDG